MDKEITALKVQKRNPQRVNVYLAGEFAFGLSRITAAWLEIGQILTADEIRELKTADDFEVGYQQAIKYLSYRIRSEREVSDNLKKHNFSDEVIQAVLERLRRLQLVDDRQFAQVWVENRNEFRPRGQRALRMELRQKGIDDHIISEVLEDLDEETLAHQAAAKQSHKYSGLPWEDFRRKLLAFLARRGFHYGIAMPVVERAWSEFGSPPKTEN
jgi:regulatory protein